MFKRIFLGMMVLPFLFGISYTIEAQGEVIFKVTIDAPEESKDVRLWLPYPKTDGEQTIEDIKIYGNFSFSKVYPQKEEGDLALYAEWTKPAKERFLTLTFQAKSIERVRKDFQSQEPDIPAEVGEYLKGSPFTPIDGKVKEIASSITDGKKSIIEKAKAVYDWTVENTFRDPNIKGCGTGDVERILSEKGGKCADISGVFVAVARAAGVPSREVYGLRLGKKDGEDITGGHHCWTEFYLPNYGWIPVDPADVRKAMLTEKLDLEQARKYRDYYFGAVDEYRIALTRGTKGYCLSPPQKGGPIPYGFMYPYAEVDGKPLEWLAAQKELKYQITFRKQ
ncbi:MAG: transglutaminase domain-containing protein [Nitrospinae bacterium]|nr:transglutaminase domain-containing protein [Nitrospinota bacterium]